MSSYHAIRLDFLDTAGVLRAWKVIEYRGTPTALEQRANLFLSGGKLRGRVAKWMQTAHVLGFASVQAHSRGPLAFGAAHKRAEAMRGKLNSETETEGLELRGDHTLPTYYAAPYRPKGSEWLSALGIDLGPQRATMRPVLSYLRRFQAKNERAAMYRAAGEFGIDPLTFQRDYLNLAASEPVLDGERKAWEGGYARRVKAQRLTRQGFQDLGNAERRAIQAAYAAAAGDQAALGDLGVWLYLSTDLRLELEALNPCKQRAA